MISKNGSETNHVIACPIEEKDCLINLLDTRKPQLVFHCAAMTDLEYCEKHPKEAYSVNVEGTRTITDWCIKHYIPLIYISTAGIFDGKKEWYTEEDTPNPITVYGQTKYEAEKYVKHYEKSYIFRASWLIGGGPTVDKKIISRLMQQIKNGSERIKAVNDIYGTLTYTEDLVTTITAVLHEEAYGLYHVASSDRRVSRYDIAKQIVTLLDLPIVVEGVPSVYFEKQFFVRRPKSESLLCERLKNLQLLRHRLSQEVLSEYLPLWQ
jgi:dTDP-4-dehydrorhamnose reductase